MVDEQPTKPTPPPELSPDGRFYWDGQRWMPMPLGSRMPRLYRPGARGCLDMGATVIIAAAVIYLIVHWVVFSGCQGVGVFDWPRNCI